MYDQGGSQYSMNFGKRLVLQTAVRLAVLLLLIIYLPWLAIVYFVSAIVDLGVMRSLDWEQVRDYLLSSYAPLWEMAPLNIAADLFTGGRPKSVPFCDLPEECRAEITEVIGAIDHQELLNQLAPRVRDHAKAMIFFKWYGRNIDSFLKVPTFHKRFRYVKTIGVSFFNTHTSTKRHFGPLRFTHRVLLNLNPHDSDGVYLEIDGKKHFWHDDPLVIFDDTYVHNSVNESDDVRYVMFVDIIRASRFGFVHRALEFAVWCVNSIVFPLREKLYNQWAFID